MYNLKYGKLITQQRDTLFLKHFVLRHIAPSMFTALGFPIIIDGHNQRWIDTDTIGHADSIDPSVKDFFFLIDSIDQRSQNPYQIDDHRFTFNRWYRSIICQYLILLSPFLRMKENPVEIFFNNRPH
jgi:hypothetical protein